MSKLKLTNHNDPGHSWYAVKRSLVKELGLEKEISPYSYQRGQTVYLEEDSDAGKFFNAYAKKVLGVEPKANGWEGWQAMKSELFEEASSYKESSPVRSYASYNPNRAENPQAGDKVKLYGKEYQVLHVTDGQVFVMNAEGNKFRLKKSQNDELEKA